MKKILLSLMLVCAFAIANAQVCGSGIISRWTGTNQPGDHVGVTQAPIIIDGNSVPDWDAYISGPFNYAGSPKLQYEPNPYLAPFAQGNIQRDGLKDSASSSANYDRDAVGQTHRDLRYFAFTYDVANVYFFFRRPANNTAQVTLYYFIDINIDGWMAQGEPVIKLTFNNSGSTIEMGYYHPALPNGIPASAFDAVKGNIMTAPTARAKTNNTSEWVVGSADGWNMPGDFVSLGNNVSLPQLGTVGTTPEVFDSRTLTDSHIDGTDAGYGVEFAVPFKYLGMYTSGGLTAGTAINYNSLFVWHVSLGGGNSSPSGAEDNAGGCCSGLGVSGTPEVTNSGTFIPKPGGEAPYDYRVRITYSNVKNYPTKITTGGIKIIDPVDNNGQPIPENVIKNWTLVGYKDVDCSPGNETNSDSTHFNWVSTVGTTYTFQAYDLLKATVLAAATPSTRCYYVDIHAFGWPPLKQATVNYAFTTDFDINSNSCDAIQGGGANEDLNALPVKLTYFNASRSGQNVNLTWQTSIEDKNTGFEIQRFIGAGGWQTIGFVATQAVNGTSNSPLNYQFSDLNDTKGITQYRLKQVDRDNRASYSLIRSVRGQGQKGKTIVYPNPSSDGKVSIIFDDVNGTRDVSVNDMSGRVVKQMKGITNNNIVIENLTAGMYSVRIVNNETGEQEVQKFVVNKR